MPYVEDITICNHCSEEINMSTDGYSTLPSGRDICETCYSDYYFTCEDCGEVTNYDNSYEAGGQYYCHDCFHESYFICPECDVATSNDDGVYHEDHDATYCYRCYDRIRSNGIDNCELIHSYDYRPNVQFYHVGKRPKLPLRDQGIGVELEVDACTNYDVTSEIDCKQIYFKHDGSLDNGFEMVSHPMSLEYHQQFHWEDILGSLRDSGFRSFNTETCGLHVHITKDILTESERVKLALLVYSNHDIFAKLAQRRNSYGQLKKLTTLTDTIKETKYNGNRMEALNFQNSQTIEFRLFKGTLFYPTFMASIELVHALVYFIKTARREDLYSRTLWEDGFSRNIQAYKKFCIFVSNNKEYKFLKDYLVKKDSFITY
ncbi:MAG: hypothetical protein HOL31_02030 [Candidatus Scalindua sp.]|nr:hypothetical protein [Candidatus Scalindua sp.]